MREREHAILSASSAHKWLNCTPSARWEESLPDTKSDYAEEGTLAHQFAELVLRKKWVTKEMPPAMYNMRLNELRENPLYQQEMERHAETYLDYITSKCLLYKTEPYVAAEIKLDYSMYATEGFGTGDCILIAENDLYVIDYKYGKGIKVDAEDNPQMMLYALAAYHKYKAFYDIKQVNMAIVQPRISNYSEWSIDVKHLLDWGEGIEVLARLAFEGKGDFCPGEHCRFCKAKAICKARAEENMAVYEFAERKNFIGPKELSLEEIGGLLSKAKTLAKWVKDIEEYALAESLKGNLVPGWKAVAGRAVRQFTDQEKAFNVLTQNGINEELLYEKVPLSLAKCEKLVGKKDFRGLLSDYIFTPQGKPTLAPENDKREKITVQEDAKSEFQENV